MFKNDNNNLAQKPIWGILRHETYVVHDRLHVHPITSPLITNNLTHNQYVLALKAFKSFYRSLESSLENISLPYVYSSRHDSIKKDLEYLGSSSHPYDDGLNLGHFSDKNYALGVLYVVEGSSLGGQMIAKNVKKVLGYSKESGASFFSGDKKKTAQNWKAFLMILEKHCDDHGKCVQGALQTFEALEMLLWSVYDKSHNISTQRKVA